MALHSVRVKDHYAHIHDVTGHMSKTCILWHRAHSKNAQFSDADASKVRPICRTCAYGESRQTGTDPRRDHRPQPTWPGQCFLMDAFSCQHTSVRGYKYCDLMRDGASQMIYCNFTKSRAASEVIAALTRTWDLNPTWRIFDRQPDPLNPRFIRMDPESVYTSAGVLSFFSERGYVLERTAPRDKHAGGIAERMVGIVTAKTNSAMVRYNVPSSYWCWAMFKTTQDLNFNYSAKIDTSPYNYVTGHHVDINYMHQFFAECYMFIPLHERAGKLPARRAHRCRFLAYSYTTILVPTFIVVIINDTGTYGNVRISKDVIFDESCVFDKDCDNSPTDAQFAAIPEIITNLIKPVEEYKVVHPEIEHVPPVIELYDKYSYQARNLADVEDPDILPLIVVDNEQFGQTIDEYGVPVYWNSFNDENEDAPIFNITSINYYIMSALYVMNIPAGMPRKFSEAFAQERWQQPINKELNNFIDNNCFTWVPDTGQRRLFMKWIFSAKADLTLKARLVARGDKCQPGIDYDPNDVYCGNVTAASIKIFFALAALYGLLLRGGDLVGAYLVTPGSKDYVLCMSTPDGIVAPPGMVLQVLGNLYGLPSSGRNFSKAVDAIVLGLGYKNTPYDPKFFVKWIDGWPILVVFHSDDFRWSGPKHLLAEWDLLVKTFEDARYKVKDCTKEPFVGITVTSDEEGNYYMDQKKAIEGVVKAAKLTGAKIQKLPYLLEGESLSKADNAKDDAEIRESAKTPYRTLIGMLSYIMGHTKPDIAYALNVLSRYCNNPGPRHIEYLRCLVKYCDYSKNDRLKFHAHKGPYDAATMREITQLRFQCDADLAGNLDNSHSTSSHLGYLGKSLISFTSKTQGSLSTSTAESEIKAVNQCLKDELLALRGMLNLMGFPQDTTIIEEDNQACVYASDVPHMTRGMRHLDLAEMLVKEKVEDKSVILLKVASADNTSDLGTKRLKLPLFLKLTAKIIDKTLRTNL